VRVSGLTFPLLRWGQDEASPVLLLHGFPQDPWVWQPVAEALARKGFQAIAPWLRGYAASNRAGPYSLPVLAADCAGIADALGLSRFQVAGFGIGGALAWVLAAWHGGRVRSVASLRFPHPAALAQAMAADRQQREKWLALQESVGAADPQGEAARLLAHRAAGLKQLLVAAELPGPFLARYVARMTRPGVLAAVLSWGQAASLEAFATVPAVQVPSLLVWSEWPAVGRAAAEATREHVQGSFREVVLRQEGHFLLESAPQVVVPPLLSWLEEWRT
jgi:pimeloyl-ACP methyl ester carboxylesterase